MNRKILLILASVILASLCFIFCREGQMYFSQIEQEEIGIETSINGPILTNIPSESISVNLKSSKRDSSVSGENQFEKLQTYNFTGLIGEDSIWAFINFGPGENLWEGSGALQIPVEMIYWKNEFESPVELSGLCTGAGSLWLSNQYENWEGRLSGEVMLEQFEGTVITKEENMTAPFMLQSMN